jgi:hypothetical protein
MSLALLLMICRKVDVRVVAFEANLLSHWADTGEPSMRLTTAGKKRFGDDIKGFSRVTKVTAVAEFSVALEKLFIQMIVGKI